ncbi:MAG: hypothetical protein J0L69_14485 [Bacteroidetes bacterium]|nr:hypothetical protein [Bacteroidota bacterium]
MNTKMLSGKRILITAGPTKEFIDPVRFISNASSGKMGYAIAEELNHKGADVILVSGPTNLKCNSSQIKIVQVTTALEMLQACQHYFDSVDIAIFTAAVADYRPLIMESSKIKKNDETITIQLTKNPDIAYEFGKVKRADQFSIGFALETDNIFEYGKGKMQKKNLDFIVLNTTNENGEGFGFDTNKISLLFRDNSIEHFPLKSKTEVASDIIASLEKQLQQLFT